MPSSRRSREQLAELTTMLRIRRFEEALVRLAADHHFGHYHVCIGQEATAVAVLSPLRDGDVSYSTHRNHGHLIARGVDPKRMLAEIFGRSTGTNGGKGGTLHIASREHGFPTTSASVGGSLPIAVGSAFAFRQLRQDHVSVCLLGDGALEEGAWHEAANIAAIRSLPVVFVCENNSQQVDDAARTTYHSSSLAARMLTDLAAPYGIPAVTIDGSDASAVKESMAMVTTRARRGEGPSFLEVQTVRWPGNRGPWPAMITGPLDVRYAWDESLVPDEHRRWFLEHDGVVRAIRTGLANGVDREMVTEADLTVARELDDAIAFARESPQPGPEQALEHIVSGGSHA